MSFDGALTIDRVNCRFRLRRAPGGPFAVRDRYRSAIERELPSACAAALGAEDGAVYRIRDVRIRMWGDVHTDEPAELADVGLVQRGPHRRDDVGDAALMGHHHVRVALDDREVALDRPRVAGDI